jgi:hypothetical protein
VDHLKGAVSFNIQKYLFDMLLEDLTHPFLIGMMYVFVGGLSFFFSPPQKL